MKRNFIITLLLTFTMLFVTACGSDNNDKNNNANSKFEGTWIAYNGSFKPKPTIQFDFSFNDSILDTAK